MKNLGTLTVITIAVAASVLVGRTVKGHWTTPTTKSGSVVAPKTAVTEARSSSDEAAEAAAMADGEPKTSVGSEVRQAEDGIPVGHWELVMAGMANPDFYTFAFAELDLAADGTYTCHGYHLGAEYKKSGVWHKDGDRVVMEDKVMISDPKRIRGLVWLDQTYAKTGLTADGYHFLQPEAGGTRTYIWGVHYSRTDKCYYNGYNQPLKVASQ